MIGWLREEEEEKCPTTTSEGLNWPWPGGWMDAPRLAGVGWALGGATL